MSNNSLISFVSVFFFLSSGRDRFPDYSNLREGIKDTDKGSEDVVIGFRDLREGITDTDKGSEGVVIGFRDTL